MDLLNLCLMSTYFQYKDEHYKQLHRTAMGSPVSVVVAEIMMQYIEESALLTCRQTIPLWLYAALTILSPPYDTTKSTHFTTTLTNKTLTCSLLERSKKIVNYAFLNWLVSCDGNSLRTTVYRKLTHTDRLLDKSSYISSSHKATTIRTLNRRTHLVCNTTDSLSDENKYLDRGFSKNRYNETSSNVTLTYLLLLLLLLLPKLTTTQLLRSQ